MKNNKKLYLFLAFIFCMSLTQKTLSQGSLASYYGALFTPENSSSSQFMHQILFEHALNKKFQVFSKDINLSKVHLNFLYASDALIDKSQNKKYSINTNQLAIDFNVYQNQPDEEDHDQVLTSLLFENINIGDLTKKNNFGLGLGYQQNFKIEKDLKYKVKSNLFMLKHYVNSFSLLGRSQVYLTGPHHLSFGLEYRKYNLKVRDQNNNINLNLFLTHIGYAYEF